MTSTSDIRYLGHPDQVARPYMASATHNGVVWACGQLPTLPDGSTPESMVDQTNATLDNLALVLADAGTSFDRLLRVTVYLSDLDEFEEFNTAYCARFEGITLPPRTTIEVPRFRGTKRIEIDAIAAS